MVYDFHNILHLNHSFNTVKELYQKIEIEVPIDLDLLHFSLVSWPMRRVTDSANEKVTDGAMLNKYGINFNSKSCTKYTHLKKYTNK